MALTRKHLIVTAYLAVRHDHGFSTTFSLDSERPRINVEAATTGEAHEAITAWLITLTLPTHTDTGEGKAFEGWAVSIRPGTYDAERCRITPTRWAPGWKAHFDRTTYHPAPAT